MTQIHPLGTLAQLWRYPIKSLLREALLSAEIEWTGLKGDRTRALIVASRDHARSRKTYRGKEHHLLHTVPGTESAKMLAAQRGVRLEERGDEGRYFDAEPVSIVVDCWIADGERLAGMPLDPQRYRPNLYVRAAPVFELDEAALVGRTIGIGNVRLQVVAPIRRCVATTYDVETGESNPHVLRAIAQERENVMGIYCRPAVPGEIRVGDSLWYE